MWPLPSELKVYALRQHAAAFVNIQIAAEKVLYEANFNRSLKHFELSRVSKGLMVYMTPATYRLLITQCSPQHIISSFAKLKKVPELVQYLHQVYIYTCNYNSTCTLLFLYQAVYDDTGHASLGNTKQAQEILFRCFLHEVKCMCTVATH